jgi:peptidase E
VKKNPPVKPLCLLADSQLLFLRENSEFLLESIMGFIESQRPKAAYIGASNDDEPAFYQIFQAAMESIGDFECRMIASKLTPDDIAFLNEADIILLAGGDVTKGWQTFVINGLREILVRRALRVWR